jgi:hypothetical protein
MKNKMPVFVGILITVLVFALMFSGCKTDDEDVEEKIERNFEGLWLQQIDTEDETTDRQYTFTGDTFIGRNNLTNMRFNGTFEYTNTEITFHANDPSGKVVASWIQEYEFTTANVLFLAWEKESHFHGRFVRQPAE